MIPEYDVLVTNPPYSEDHVKRCLAFCMRSNKPWLVLLPNYVAAKPYYAPILAGRAGAKWGGPPADLEEGVPPVAPFYVVPKKRYNYWSPKGIDRYNPRVRKDGRTSPFITFWCAATCRVLCVAIFGNGPLCVHALSLLEVALAVPGCTQQNGMSFFS